MSLTNYKQRPVGFFSNQQRRKEKGLFEFNLQSWIKKTLIQMGICALLLLTLLTFRIIDSSITNRIRGELAFRLNQPFYVKESVLTMRGWGEGLLEKGESALGVFKLWDITAEPFIQPMEGEVIAGFQEISPINGQILKGIILEGNQGEAVLASEEGVVVEVSANQAVGNYIIIKHRGELLSVYKYLEKPFVEVNTKVLKGEKIAESTGKLLFEIWQRKEPVDPYDYIQPSRIQL